MSRLEELKRHLRPGKSYRRQEIAAWSRSVDRDLQTLVEEGFLKKLANGIYYRPKQSVFGETPVDDHDLVRTFLKDDRFLLTSPNAYHALGLGTTQLYNQRVVYNHKRHGDVQLGGRMFSFRRTPYFSTHAVTPEFLLVDLVNNIDELAEDRELLLRRVRDRAAAMNRKRLSNAVAAYGKANTKRFFRDALANVS